MGTTVALVGEGLLVHCASAQDSEYVKQIPGRQWAGRRNTLAWSLPLTADSVELLQRALPGVYIPESVMQVISGREFWDEEIISAKSRGWSQKPAAGLVDAELYEHQKAALGLGMLILKDAGRSAYGMWHDMGLGKTLTTLALLGQMWHESETQKDLRGVVLCPVSVINVWTKAAEQFCLYPVRVLPLTGPTPKRAARVLANNLLPFEGVTLYVTNYESIWRGDLYNALEAADWDVMVCDEAHRLKTPRSKQSEAARKLSRNAKRIALTGTPVDRLQDWYGIYRWLDPNVFGTSEAAFRARYFHQYEVDRAGHMAVAGPKQEMLPELLEKANHAAHACKKEDALDLPERIDIDLECELEPAAMRIYKQMRDEALALLDSGGVVLGQNALTRIMRLAQITGGYITTEDGPQVVSEAKMKMLKDTIENALETERKIVIVAHYTAEIDGILKMLRSAPFYMGRSSELDRPGVIDGRVSAKQRDEWIDRFQDLEDDMRVMVVQEQAGGAGITLHASSLMITYSTGSSSIDWRQVRDRIHRIGQTQKCRYVNIVTENLIDRKILDEGLRSKLELASMSADDARKLLLN